VEVRDAVHREWANVRRLEANEAFARGILERYVVTIERPNGVGSNVAMRGDASP
jgi:uncharacterized linocin/CFP29 family protein